MAEEYLTPKERWLRVLQHKVPDRVPMDYWATGEVTRRLIAYLGCRDVWEMYRRLHIDKPIHVGPKYVGPRIPEDADMWGCRYRYVRYGAGDSAGVYRECIYHPLAEYRTPEEVERCYRWPSLEWFDFSVIPSQVEGREEYPVVAGGMEIFLIYKHLRGEKQAYLDLIRNPEMVHYCLDKLLEFHLEYTKSVFEQLPKDLLVLSYVAEDLGGQNDLLYSPAQIREFILPRLKRMIGLVHHYGAYVFHHDDGAIRRILPDLVKAGIDVLNPVQWRCRWMDRESLKRDFGDKIVFHGAMDNQHTLAFGTEEEIRREVRDNIRILGRNGGYILAPCHNIQPITPPEKIVAMYDEGYKYGRYY